MANQTDQNAVPNSAPQDKPCGCGQKDNNGKPCSCHKKNWYKVGFFLLVIGGVGYWAYSKGYLKTFWNKTTSMFGK